MRAKLTDHDTYFPFFYFMNVSSARAARKSLYSGIVSKSKKWPILKKLHDAYSLSSREVADAYFKLFNVIYNDGNSMVTNMCELPIFLMNFD